MSKLVELRDAVVSGEYTHRKTMCKEAGLGDHYIEVARAYNGSLDAANDLHDAVLNGWNINLAIGYCHVIPPTNNGDQYAKTGYNDIMARAWLIAILNALIEQEKE